MTNTIINDQRPSVRQKIESLESEIVRLEVAIKAEWAAIKDFVISYGDTLAGTNRIEHMKSSINSCHKDIRKLKKKLLKLNDEAGDHE